MSPRHVLVTGGHGFLGTHLVRALLTRGDTVTVYDAAPPPPHAADTEWVAGDVRDRAALGHAARDADVLVHLAAVVGVDTYLGRPSDVLGVNVDGTRCALDVAVARGARFVLASTSEVYGRNPAVPWDEDSDRVLGPTSTSRWAYSTSKALSEHLVAARAEDDDLDFRIVRYFNAYGPGQRPAFVLSRSVHRALNGRPLVLYDGGRQTRCFTAVADAIEGTLAVVDADDVRGEIFNIGSDAERTIDDALRLTSKIASEASGRPEPAFRRVDTRAAWGRQYEDLDRRVPGTEKARRLLGWSATTDLEAGLRRSVEWALANPWWLDQADSGAD